MVQIQRTNDEIFERAKELYENVIKHQLTDDQLGMCLSIDVDSSDFEIGEKPLDTALSLKARRPDATIFSMLHGSYTSVYMGFAPLEPGSIVIDRRGVGFFEKHVKHKLSDDELNMVVAFDIDTGEYEVDETMVDAGNRLKARLVSSNIFFHAAKANRE